MAIPTLLASTGFDSGSRAQFSGVGDGPFLEQGGLEVVEVEHHHPARQRGARWRCQTTRRGYVGDGSVAAVPNAGVTLGRDNASRGPELRFSVRFATPGIYTVWLRAQAWRSDDNSVYVGLDAPRENPVKRIDVVADGAWNWAASGNGRRR